MYSDCWTLPVEQLSFECRTVIGFALTTLHDWLKNHTPICHPIRCKSKTNRDPLAHVPRFASASCISTCNIQLIHCIVCVFYDWLERFLLSKVLRHSIENRCKPYESVIAPLTMRLWKPLALFSFFRDDPEITFTLSWGRCAPLQLSLKAIEAGFLAFISSSWKLLPRSRASSKLESVFFEPVLW